MKNMVLRIRVPPSDREVPCFLSKYYLIAKVWESKEKLFTSEEQDDDGPSEEDDQKDDKLSD